MNIIRPGTTFRAVSSRSVYERDYVESILLVKSDLFPGFNCDKFSAIVESDHGSARPDLVLIDEHCRNWYVVEVELEHHSLSNHVEPQIRRLRNGDYSNFHADRIAELFQNLPAADLRRMVRSSQPDVLVVVPEIRERWVVPLRQLGAKLMVFQVFEDEQGHRLYRVNGDEITAYPSHIIGVAHRTPAIRIALSVSGIPSDEVGSEMELLFGDEITRWKILRTDADLLLLPRDRCPLPEQLGESYIITSSDQGVWRLEVEHQSVDSA